jgi:hypothetical protein
MKSPGSLSGQVNKHAEKQGVMRTKAERGECPGVIIEHPVVMVKVDDEVRGLGAVCFGV